DLEKPDGRALLCDFGLALAAGDDRLTRTGELVGTPAFLAPEQAKNKGQGPPVDIFALGGVLHFALTGRLAHGADAKMWHAVVMAIMKNPAEPLRSVRAEVPEELEKIVLRCLEKDPANRFPSAGVLEYALLDCLRAGRTAQRRRAGVILAAAAVAGGVGAAVALRGHGGGGGQPPPAPVVTTSSPTTPTDPGAGLKECVRTKNWKGAVACLDGLPGWPLQERLDFGTQALATDPSLAVKIAVGGARRIVGDDDEDRPDLEAFLHQVFAQTPEASVGAVALAALAAGLDLGPDRQRIALDIASFADESAPGLKERVLATLACGEPVEGRFRSKAGLREPSQNLSITERVDRDAWPKPSGTPNPIEQLADARWFARNGGEEASRRAQALIENARLGLEGHHEHDDDVEAAVLELEIARSPVEALAKLGDARSLQRQILRAQASRAVAERETDEAKRREAEDVAVQRWRALIDANPKDDYLLAFAHASLARLEHHLGHEHPARAWYARARIAVESGTAELDKVAAEIFEKQR
ncbi:MAG TPA: hypothetical protein VFF73_37210, partial [Planctomycetota bacterium]|nr:hypothetical protein [Planctomycetota bacterium]